MSVFDKLGGSEEQYQKEEKKKQNLQIPQFNENKAYTHRILAGPKRVDTVWYPCTYKDKDTGKLNASMNKLFLKPKKDWDERAITDTLYLIDKTLQEENEKVQDKEINPVCRRTTRYLYVVISRDRSKDGEPWIGLWEYPASVSNQIRKKQSEESSSKKGFLNFGPYWTYDVVVTRNQKSGSNSYYGISYNLSVDIATLKHGGEIPTEVVTDGAKGKQKHKDLLTKVEHEVFTPKELEAVDDFFKNNDLDNLDIMIGNNEQLQQVFEQVNFNPRGMNKSKDNMLLSDPDTFIKKLKQRFSDNPEYIPAYSYPEETKTLETNNKSKQLKSSNDNEDEIEVNEDDFDEADLIDPEEDDGDGVDDAAVPVEEDSPKEDDIDIEEDNIEDETEDETGIEAGW